MMAAKKKKELTPEAQLKQLHVEYLEERTSWEAMFLFGCQDPFWPDGTNLNLIRSHCIYYLRQMKQLCKEHSLQMPKMPVVPDEVDENYMAPQGRFPNRLVNADPTKDFQLSLEF